MTKNDYARLLDNYVQCQLSYWLSAEGSKKDDYGEAMFQAFECARRCIEKREAILNEMKEQGHFTDP